MPKLDVEIAEQLPEPEEGKIYTIESAEAFTSQVRSYKGIRVSMVDENNKHFVVPIWTRDIVGSKSKLGAFITALGQDTDTWTGTKIRFAAWRQGNRKIEVV